MATQARITLTAEDRASRVISQVRTEMGRASASASQLAGAAGLISPAFAALAGAAGLVAFVKSVVDAADALNDVADATGASVEALSGLERVARLNGGTLDDVAGVLVKFNAALNQAADPKSDAAAVFTALGLSAKELQAADPADALQRAAVALQGFANDGNKARIIQELFGKSIREAAPFLKDLAEAGKLQATTTTEQAEAAEKFNKELFKLSTNANDAARAIVSKLVPALNGLIEDSRQGGIAKALGLQDLPLLVDQLVNGYRLAGLARERITPLQILEKNPQNAAALAELARIEDKAKGIAKVFTDARRAYLKIGESMAGAGRGFINPPLIQPSLGGLGTPGKSVTPPKEEINQAATALAAYIGQLDKEITKTQELTIVQEALLQLQESGDIGKVPIIRAAVLARAEGLQLAKQEQEIEAGITAELERQAKMRQGLDEALDRFSGRTADALKQAQTSRLETRLAAGEVFSPEELDRIVKGIGGIKDEAEKAFDGADKALERFVENVQDALGNTIEATLRGDFDSIGRLWADLLIKMASQAIAADIGRALFGDMGKGAGGVSSGGVLSGLVGAVFGGLSGARAGGGPVNAGGTYLVGERGPELLQMGGSSGRVVSNSAARALQGATSITMPVSIHIDARSDQAQVAQLVAGAMAQTQRNMWAQLHARGVA